MVTGMKGPPAESSSWLLLAILVVQVDDGIIATLFLSASEGNKAVVAVAANLGETSCFTVS
jgi:hypothetical protein